MRPMLLFLICLLLWGCVAQPAPMRPTGASVTTPAPEEAAPTQTQKVPVVKPMYQKLSCTSIMAKPTLLSAPEGKLAIGYLEKGIASLLHADPVEDYLLNGRESWNSGWELQNISLDKGFYARRDVEEGLWEITTLDLFPTTTFAPENMDGFPSWDGRFFYYLRQGHLLQLEIASGDIRRVGLEIDLRFSQILSFQPEQGQMLLELRLSPYESSPGTALVNVNTGKVELLLGKPYQVGFSEEGVVLIRQSEGAQARVFFTQNGSFYTLERADFQEVLMPVANSPYLLDIGAQPTLYVLSQPAKAAELHLEGNIVSACVLTTGELALAVQLGGRYEIYFVKPGQLCFREIPTTPVSPETLSREELPYWSSYQADALPETMAQLEAYAQALRQRYGVEILLGQACQYAVQIWHYPVTGTDQMDFDNEIHTLFAALEALDRSLSQFPEGAFSQLGVDLQFLLVGAIGDGIPGCCFGSGTQYQIGVDVSREGLESIYCHGLWHAVQGFSPETISFLPEHTVCPQNCGFGQAEVPEGP